MPEKKPMEGEEAPDFDLPEASEEMISLSDLLEKGTAVLIFYPVDFGITCTLEFKKFNEMLEDFSKAGGGLVGISVSSTRSHRSWKEKMNLGFPLLSDSDAKVAKLYDVMSPEDNLLKGYSTRAIFIVDRAHVIRYRWVPLDSHTQPDYDLVLQKVREIKSG
jgi:peroxiredoxin Q/BCP